MNTLLSFVDRPAQYSGLIERMARALGIDLQAAAKAGRIDKVQLQRVNLRCALCDQPKACARLLSARPDLDAAPDYCVNQKALGELTRDGTLAR